MNYDDYKLACPDDEKHNLQCDVCGDFMDKISELVEHNGEKLCGKCYEKECGRCETCGELEEDCTCDNEE